MSFVQSKKKNLEGYVLGVEFKDGEAETDSPAALAFFSASTDYDVVDDSKTSKIPTGDGTP